MADYIAAWLILGAIAAGLGYSLTYFGIWYWERRENEITAEEEENALLMAGVNAKRYLAEKETAGKQTD